MAYEPGQLRTEAEIWWHSLSPARDVIGPNPIKGRVQLVAGSQFVFSAILKKLKPTASLNPVFIFEKTPMFNAFSKKAPHYKKMKASFDKGLDLIKKDQTYEKIMKKHGF